jgi:hypothetical protein
LQADPIGAAGGANRYAYVADDPVNHADPSGLELWIIGNDKFKADIQALRAADPKADAVFRQLEQSADIYVIVQRNDLLASWTIGGRSADDLSHESDLARSAAAEYGITDDRVRGVALIGEHRQTPQAWVAWHEAIHLKGIDDRDKKYSHKECAFDYINSQFKKMGYPVVR